MSQGTYRKLFWAILIGVLLIHVVFLKLTPWEWDEPVYTSIATQTAINGFPSLPLGDGQTFQYYPYHPPFHFYLMAGFYQLVGENSIAAGRILSTMIAVAMVGMGMIMTKVISDDRPAALLAGLLLALDGWTRYSTNLVKIDSMTVTIGMLGLLLFILSVDSQSKRLNTLAALVLGLCLIYKHIGVLMVGGVVAYRFLTGDRTYFSRTLAIAIAVLSGYVLIMSLTVGDVYVNATLVQIRRTIGLQEARGLSYSIAEALQALAQTYWAFSSSIVAVGIGLVVMVWNAWQHRHGKLWSLSIITAWAVSATLGLILIRLRNPHYLIYLSTPLMILLAVELRVLWMQDRLAKWITSFLVGISVLLNVRTLAIRATDFSQGDTFQRVQEYLLTQTPSDWTIVADEPFCSLPVPQTCYPIGVYQSEARLLEINPDVVILYSTTTQHPPNSDALNSRLAGGVEMARFQDWKGVVNIIRIR